MGFDSLMGMNDSRRTTRLVLMAIIVLTLPCYCLGVVLLATAPEDVRKPTTIPANATLGAGTASPFTTVTNTPFRTATSTPFGGGVLNPTPTQIYLYPTANVPAATWTSVVFPTSTPFPTWTTAPTLTLAPSSTLAPSNTPAPTATLAPTNTPVPSNTPIPTDTPTEVTPPTLEPVATNTEEPPPINETPTQDKLDDPAQ